MLGHAVGRTLSRWKGWFERSCWSGLPAVSYRLSSQLFENFDSTNFSDENSSARLEKDSTGQNIISKSDPLQEEDFFQVHKSFTVRQLFEARVHLGHKAGRWNPLMKPYIYGTRAGMHILDLDKTAEHLRHALNVTAHIAYRRGVILFINERPQFEGVIHRTARQCGEYYVTKWRGGTLTNSFKLLNTLRLPDLVILTSVPQSKTAVKEAATACVPSIGIIDTDCDPNLIMYPVPGNDDTPSSMVFYCRLFADVINKAKGERKRVEEMANSPQSYAVALVKKKSN